jgi:hypothetical protein
MAIVANARYTARASRADRLREIEGGEYESQQNFLGVAARIAKEEGSPLRLRFGEIELEI